MKRSNPAQKLDKKKRTLAERTALILGVDETQARHLLSITRHQSLRRNTLKSGSEAMPVEAWIGAPYGWMPEGYHLGAPVSAVRDHGAITSGQLFIQNAASWLPVLALDPQAGEYILDVCAAPGGKTSHIAAVTNNQAYITANDNSRPRLAKLQANLERLGATVDQYTLYDATALARKLEGRQFDRILIDAPCSGEGLMNINNDKDMASWSVAHIKRLQQLQKRIITQAWQLLKPGGTLVYSTCTMAPEENEAVIDYVLRSQPDAAVEPFELELENRVPAVTEWNGRAFNPLTSHCARFKPSEEIEAFFVCKLKKTSQSD